ncbi:hypothetical protein V8G54_008318 [Vigna mungo]|uniref:Uncharacterized protein n=1 Tax=Vigna mungo TaxID=3915 RepID=A0AAQ3P2Y1_VIGMU
MRSSAKLLGGRDGGKDECSASVVEIERVVVVVDGGRLPTTDLVRRLGFGGKGLLRRLGFGNDHGGVGGGIGGGNGGFGSGGGGGRGDAECRTGEDVREEADRQPHELVLKIRVQEKGKLHGNGFLLPEKLSTGKEGEETQQHAMVKGTVEDVTLEEAWSIKQPVVKYFKVFGCVAHADILGRNRVKLDDKSRKCFMGIRDEFQAWRLYDPIKKFLKLETRQEEIIYKDKNDTTTETTTTNFDTSENSEEGNSTHLDNTPTGSSQERGTQVRRAPRWLVDYDTSTRLPKDENMATMLMTETNPTSFEEAVTSISRTNNLRLLAFSDSDYAGDLDDRKSTYGYVLFMLGARTIF